MWSRPSRHPRRSARRNMGRIFVIIKNLRSYRVDETRCAKVVGVMSRSSSSLYRLVFMRNCSASVCTSVARPGSPTYVRSLILKIFVKSVPMVRACTPKRRSAAMATQFLPFMAMIADPLYSMIDCVRGEYHPWIEPGETFRVNAANAAHWSPLRPVAHRTPAPGRHSDSLVQLFAKCTAKSPVHPAHRRHGPTTPRARSF